LKRQTLLLRIEGGWEEFVPLREVDYLLRSSEGKRKEITYFSLSGEGSYVLLTS